MLLGIDVGNSNVVLGVFEGDTLRASWRIHTRTAATADEYGVLIAGMFAGAGLDPAIIDGVALASVVPPLTPAFAELAWGTFRCRPLVIDAGVKTGVKVRYDSPRDVGADRVCNAAAACRYYGAPACIIDFGTGTTFDAIDADGQYLGGAIAPGIEIAADALAARAAKLRRIELVAPPHAIGANTAHAVQSGLIYGYVGLVEGMVARFRAELGGDPYVLATGGLADTIAPLTRAIDGVDPWITLKGLRLIWQANAGRTP